MDTRRDFIKKAALLSGAAGISSVLSPAIQRALAINPEPGSTYLDAEHIVLLMQENRSFDHCFGTLRGVRGFNDPRAITIPGRNKVWLQTNAAGETYAPFRLNIKDTKATWMSALPHSRESQIDARNNGKHNHWLDAKRSGHKEYAHLPLTMGYYTREDLPFYYALADAFTVCDQHFCACLTPTTPNRLFFWTGTVRPGQSGKAKANVRNQDVDYSSPASWDTFPERLEENGISWKIYQNEISLEMGLEDEEDEWLSNFTDNPLEWFSQYHVKLSPKYIHYLQKQAAALAEEIRTGEGQNQPATEEAKKELAEKRAKLETIQEELKKWQLDQFDKLPQREKNLHKKAFTVNENDPFYHELSTLSYHDGSIERQMKVPKGDVLHQLREDVKNNTLPTVSWIVAPENFSDHPGAPWYGAWYVSEVLDILTQRPELWKKTIFILTYDENDGYFDHIPPFVVPDPNRPHAGLTSKGIDPSIEYIQLEQELQQEGLDKEDARGGPIGLGFRVPMVIASPWTRGGWVCSEVFDHTSTLQFMENFLNNKFNREIKETNISAWRRTICGDLSSVFRPYHGEKMVTPPFPPKDAFIESVHKAKFKKIPTDYKLLTKAEMEQINRDPSSSPYMPRQEKGIRPSCPLSYELYTEGTLDADKKTVSISFRAGDEVFGKQSAGAPFNVYAPGKYNNEEAETWAYTVAAGDSLKDTWPLQAFGNGIYHLCVYGPNGYFREFSGNADDPQLEIKCSYAHNQAGEKKLNGNIRLMIANLSGDKPYTITIRDNAYKSGTHNKVVLAGEQVAIDLDLSHSFGWYDFSVQAAGYDLFAKRYAGHVETGEASYSDPVMGQVIL